MDRVISGFTVAAQVAIVRELLRAQEPRTPYELRVALDVQSRDRAHFGRQVTQLYHLGILERTDDRKGSYVVAEPDLVERFLLLAGDLEAALDARRASRSRERARTHRKESLTRETRRRPSA